MGIIMSSNENSFSEWKPQLSDDALKHIEKLRSSIEPKLSLMKRFRVSLGMTQVEAAELLGMSQANVSKLEKKGDPNVSILSRLAEAKGLRLRLAAENSMGVTEKVFELS